MKVAVFSDTHGVTTPMVRAIRQVRPDALVHLGDYERDTAVLLKEFPELPLYHVCGNCDYAPSAPNCLTVQLGPVTVFLTHGHRYGVSYTLRNLRETAEEYECDVAIYGHTHMPAMDEQNGILLLNPGSVAKPRQAGLDKTYAVIDINNKTGKMKVRFKKLPGKGWW
jgi:putative phosphoesterase